MTDPSPGLARHFRTLDEGRYCLSIPDLGIELEVDRLRRKSSELVGELTARCSLAGAHTFDGVLSIADLNLSSQRSRVDRARYFAARSEAKEIDWVGLLEEFVQRVLAVERTGQPAILLRDVPRPKPDDTIEVAGLPLLRRHPAVWFGDGGAAKSYLALYVAGKLAQQGLRVLLADWELAAEDHRDRLERLFGTDMPCVYYVRCERPLVFEMDRLRRIARDEKIDFNICDSVAFACDGPPEAADVAAGYFRALRRIGTGSLNIAHINKSDSSDHKPFGSAFWHHGARATWFVKRVDTLPDSKQISIGLFNRKANLASLHAPVGFAIGFTETSTSFRHIDVASVPDLAGHLSVRQRMTIALHHGAMTPNGYCQVEAVSGKLCR